METKKQYSYIISLLRIFSMLCIITCHIASRRNHTAIAQFFNVGVPIFALISGYLYGSRDFSGSWSWLCKRYIRLVMPILAYTVVYTIMALIHHSDTPTWYQYLFLLFDLQGLNFIFYSIKDIFIGPWFFTSILCCYIVLWLYTSYEKKHPDIRKIFNYGGILPLVVFIILGCFNISIKLLLIFFIGYILAKDNILERKADKLFIGSIIQFIVAVAIRIVCKRFLDGTRIYDNTLVAISHTGIAISALCIFKWFEKVAPKAVNAIGKNRFVHHIDNISIYVYISHDWFITGVIATMFDGGINPFILYPLYACVVIFTASLLYFIFEKLGVYLTNHLIVSSMNNNR